MAQLKLYEDDVLTWFPVQDEVDYTDIIIEVPDELKERIYRFAEEWTIIQDELRKRTREAGY